LPYISVAGIAGPGDAFCTPDLTLKTFELIRKKNTKISLCVSTNGLNILDYIPTLSDLNVQFVTITVNCIDPVTGAKILKWVDLENSRLKGIEAAGILEERQLEAIGRLKSKGFMVKVNSVVIPGVNDDHLVFLAKKIGAMGVDLMNLIPLIPVKGTDMENAISPSKEMINRLRKAAGAFVPQMHHCTRCRSDAVGLLGELC
jgi:nitrogen fixation protein NifB